MGVAHVRIGDDALDWETLHRLSTSKDPAERPIAQLEQMEQLAVLGPNARVKENPDAQAFFALVNKALAASPNSELLIYVHGSNNTVPRSAAQSASFAISPAAAWWCLHSSGLRRGRCSTTSPMSAMPPFRSILSHGWSSCWPTTPRHRG
jgi:hypothetical protein